MKTITTPRGKVLVDESAEIKVGDYVYKSKSDKTMFVLDDFGKHLHDRGSSGDGYCKIIATINHSISLDVPMVTVVDEVKELALKEYPNKTTAGYYDHWSTPKRKGFNAGFKAAQQKGVYSEADIRNTFQAGVMYRAAEGKAYPRSPNIESIIESLNQEPIELEMEDSKTVEKYEFDGTEHGEILWARQLKTNRVNGQLTAYVKT